MVNLGQEPWSLWSLALSWGSEQSREIKVNKSPTFYVIGSGLGMIGIGALHIKRYLGNS